jgi:hypothetical protein
MRWQAGRGFGLGLASVTSWLWRLLRQLHLVIARFQAFRSSSLPQAVSPGVLKKKYRIESHTFEGDAKVDNSDLDEHFRQEVWVRNLGCHVQFELRMVIDFLISDTQ